MERIATRLFPHRVTMLTAGLGAFLLAALPLARVAAGDAALSAWHVALFTACVPLVLWSIGLACLATFFDPAHGLVHVFGGRSARVVRAYALVTCVGFAAAPLVVLLGAAR